ncbi:Dual specificity protein phosphatase 23 [Chitinispirillum alkaliphilum]|nr:Dual specificity protein phosphatase 23 [Chitinispirillum alkaliphilum]
MILNFSWVIPSKLSGCSLPRGQKDIEFLYSQGVKRLVSLKRPSDEISVICEQQGLKWTYFGITDFSVPNNDYEFDELVNSIISDMDNGIPCCVHCHAGIGRTGMLLACILGKYFKISAEKAIQAVKKTRSAIDTGEQVEYVYNYLREYEN